MNDKHRRIADFITRLAFPDPDIKPTPPRPRLTFLEWSQQVGTKPFVWPERPKQRLGITTRLMTCVYPWRPIDLDVGEPHATVTRDHAIIRFPEPFDPNGELTDACRAFIVEAVKAAIERDGLRRNITWPDPPSDHHGDQA